MSTVCADCGIARWRAQPGSVLAHCYSGGTMAGGGRYPHRWREIFFIVRNEDGQYMAADRWVEKQSGAKRMKTREEALYEASCCMGHRTRIVRLLVAPPVRSTDEKEKHGT